MADRILIVDDEPVLADSLAMIFRKFGYLADAAYGGEAALLAMAANPASLVVTDVMMPDMNGIDLAKKIKKSYPSCWVILFSGNAHVEDLMRTARLDGHTFEVLTKPISPRLLLDKVESLLGR